MARAPAPIPKRGRTNAEKASARAATCDRIQKLLAEKAMTMHEVKASMGMAWSLIYTYMTQMERDGQVRRTGKFVNRSAVWETGARQVEMGKDTPEQQGASLHALEQALARPARGVVA